MRDKILEEDLTYIAEAECGYEQLYGKSILVTGATGLVGSQTVKSASENERVKRGGNNGLCLCSKCGKSRYGISGI